MEKTPAAYSMEWSLELEKGLRSKSPAKHIEAISKIGPRLEWWNRQSKISGAEYKMFGLIPGEDKLFLNAIILRLADAFRIGDRKTKYCIVKSFIEGLKCRRKRGSACEKGEECVFSKNKLDNYLEILRRVKIVFDDGDIEDRALALYLFGCWADFAKDNADVRYCILLSSVSDDILQVKASMFAAGRFSELADDFASVFLDMLTNRLTSFEISPAFKLAGCRIFSKMHCSFSLANRAYKTGLRMLLDSSDQKFSLEMLISLTKIASRWTMLIPTQLELLSMFLVKDGALCMQVTTLRCLQCVFATGICPSLAARGMILNLIDVVSKSKYSSALLGKALKILHQILCYYLPTLHVSEMRDVLSMLFTFIENIFQSSTMSERYFATWILLDILGKFLGRDQLELNETASTLAHQVITFVTDHVSMLLKLQVDKHQFNEEMDQEVTSVLRLLLNLIENHSVACGLVLDKVAIFMKHLVNVLGDISLEKEGVINCEISKCVIEDERPNPLKSAVLLTKMMNICLDSLEVNFAIPYDVFNRLKLLVDSVLLSASCQLYTRSTYMLLLHFHGACLCMWQETNHVLDNQGNYNLSCGDSIIQHDSLIVEFAKKIFERRDYWSFYKAGKLAACHGSWSTAAFIFEQLMKRVLSDSNYTWLKSLALFSRSESQLEFSRHIAIKDSLVKEREGVASVFNWIHYSEALGEACNGLHTANRTLFTSVPGLSIKFQKWFLLLRTKFLEIMKDTISLLGGVSFKEDTNSDMQREVFVSLPSLIPLERLSSLVGSLSQISRRLNKVANEYDLLALSFVGMDTKSAKGISALAASCSLLAFSTGFALSIPLLHASGENLSCSLESSEEQFQVMLIHDLLERLCLTESETRKSLLMLLEIYKMSVSCFLSQSQNKALSISCRARGFVKVCRYAVMGIVSLKNEASQMRSEESVSKLLVDGFQLLLRLIFNWMHIPFRCPSYYFQVKHEVTSELFVMDGDGKTIDGTSVLSGSPLFLNVCLQLKNMPLDLLARMAKLYCILSCALQLPQAENKEQSWLNSETLQIDEILDLNGKLARYVTSMSSNYNGMHCGNQASNSLAVEEYLHFLPNERGQGLSTCLLDISAFPVGIYRIQWHSCLIDNEGSYWSLLPLNAGPSFIIAKSSTSR